MGQQDVDCLDLLFDFLGMVITLKVTLADVGGCCCIGTRNGRKNSVIPQSGTLDHPKETSESG
jgi:hypothetical protein